MTLSVSLLNSAGAQQGQAPQSSGSGASAQPVASLALDLLASAALAAEIERGSSRASRRSVSLNNESLFPAPAPASALAPSGSAASSSTSSADAEGPAPQSSGSGASSPLAVASVALDLLASIAVAERPNPSSLSIFNPLPSPEMLTSLGICPPSLPPLPFSISSASHLDEDTTRPPTTSYASTRNVTASGIRLGKSNPLFSFLLLPLELPSLPLPTSYGDVITVPAFDQVRVFDQEERAFVQNIRKNCVKGTLSLEELNRALFLLKCCFKLITLAAPFQVIPSYISPMRAPFIPPFTSLENNSGDPGHIDRSSAPFHIRERIKEWPILAPGLTELWQRTLTVLSCFNYDERRNVVPWEWMEKTPYNIPFAIPPLLGDGLFFFSEAVAEERGEEGLFPVQDPPPEKAVPFPVPMASSGKRRGSSVVIIEQEEGAEGPPRKKSCNMVSQGEVPEEMTPSCGDVAERPD
jgi:hypothetical protein